MGTYLNKTPGSEGNRKTWTFSTWIKRSSISTGGIFTAGGSGQDQTNITFSSSGGNDRIDWQIYSQSSGSTVGRLVTTQQFRDTAAWYHLVCRYDSTQGTAGDRMRMYLNGSEITAFSTDTNPTQNFDAMINNTVVHDIGRTSYNNSNFFSGYLAETILADGQSYAPTSFGETDSTTGIWIPKTFSGSYGTNGFKLEYKNANALGTDTSGQSNNFTASNFATSNQVVDTPTNNFSIMNPLNIFPNSTPIITQGGLQTESQSTSGAGLCSTMAVSNGKWYVEGKIGSGATLEVGAVDIGTNAFNKGGTSTNSVGYAYGGTIRVNNSNTQTSLSTYTGGDIIGILLNMDTATGTVTFYKNNSVVGSAQNFTTSKPNAAAFYMQSHTSGGNQSVQWNFGNPSFSISSGNADANGYGNFEYAVPSGYYALCTENLNTYG